jgi:type IV pilus assembly protein PilQ
MKNLIKKNTLFRILSIWLIVFSCCVVSRAVDAMEQEQMEEKPLSQLELRMQKMVSIDVSDVPIEVVIRQLAEQVDVDFIKSPNVTGNVTVTLTGVSVEEALQSILDVHGCAYIKGENVVRILSREEMPEISERLITETFEIIYADVVEVVKALDKFKSPQGSVSSIQGTSHIIVTDTEGKVRDIAKLIEKIDRITPQVLVEVRIYDITSKDNLDLGIDWYASRRTNFNSSGFPIDDDIAVNRDGTDTYISSITDSALHAGFSAGTSKTAAATEGYMQFGILNKNVDIFSQLRAEQENINAKLLANPRIMVLDNETALFDIVTEHPYVERTITGATITETVKFKNVGIKLGVTPHVTRDGMVRMRILPEFGVVIGQVQVSSSDVPIVDTRKVDTIALVQNGHAVVIGGLRKKDTTQQINKVPLLGDLPILGALFKFEGESTVITELVVFITPPMIVTEPVLTETEQQAYDVTIFDGPKSRNTKAEDKLERK